MQIKVNFTTSGLCLPLAYRHYVQSMLYDAMRADPDFSTELHDGKATPSGRLFKGFTFGQLEGKYSVQDGQICFPNEVNLEIRSVNEKLMLLLFRAFSVRTEHRLEKNLLHVNKCTMEDHRILDSEILIQTRSPIVSYLTLDQGKTRFFSPEEERFYTLIYANARRKWESIYGTAFPEDFTITRDGSKLKKQVTLFKGTRITAWDGRFRLRGDPALLTFLYNTGLGAKSSQGFGLFEQVL